MANFTKFQINKTSKSYKIMTCGRTVKRYIHDVTTDDTDTSMWLYATSGRLVEAVAIGRARIGGEWQRVAIDQTYLCWVAVKDVEPTTGVINTAKRLGII